MRRLLWVLLFVLVLAGLAAGGAYYTARDSLPRTEGHQTIAGLKAKVEVLRDRHGIPHIFAATPADAYRALGYAHAQDRLWQMEMNRRIGQGRLAELFGREALDTDRFMRTLGLYHRARQDVAALDPETRQMLEAYAGGVNAFLETRRTSLPPEFLILGTKPEPWQPADTLVWLKLMALDMGYNWRVELGRFLLLSRLTPEQVAQFYPAYPGEPAHDFSRIPALYAELPEAVLGASAPSAAADGATPLGPEATGGGSNNWVVAGSRTASGKPMLANDPHLALTTPSIWYLAHLNVAGHNVVGATMPGVPFVVLGRNDRFAWGFTNTAPDVHDLYIERVRDPEAGTYDTPTGTATFTQRVEVIRIKGGANKVLTVRTGRHGPVISDVLPELKQRLGDGYAMSLQWVALQPGDTTARAGRLMAAARDWPGFVTAARDFISPQQNIVYADVDGNIGYVSPGRVPVRGPDHPTRGLLPAPGWLAASEWTGWIPPEAMPMTANPASGWIATANQKVVDADYPYHLTADWELPYRYNRIARLLEATPRHDMGSFRAIQADVVDGGMHDSVQALLSVLGEVPDDLRPVLQALRAWDGAMTADRPEPLIAAAWNQAFSALLYRDDLGPLFAERWKPRPEFIKSVLADPASGRIWCDIRLTPRAESCADLARQSLTQAMDALGQRHGRHWDRWRWIAALRADQQHRPMSEVGWLRKWFASSTAIGGGPDSPNVALFDYSGSVDFKARVGPSYRAIYDLADLDASRYIIPTGQSGHPLSPHYRDMEDHWAHVRSITIATQRPSIEQARPRRLELLPVRE